jgi:hypothetical protein
MIDRQGPPDYLMGVLRKIRQLVTDLEQSGFARVRGGTAAIGGNLFIPSSVVLC